MGRARPITDNQAHLQVIREGMMDTMRPGGSGYAVSIGAPYQMAGKTGTAQVVSRKGVNAVDPRNLPMHLRHRSLFVGFAPADNPSIVLAIAVEGGGYGASTAAPIARKIFDAWLLGKMPQLTAEEAAAAGDAETARWRRPATPTARLRRPRRKRRPPRRARNAGTGRTGAAAMMAFLHWLGDLAHRLVRTLDWPLCAALGALMAFGLLVMHSAGGPHLVMAQGSRFAVGVLAMWGISRISPLRLRAWTPLIYALSMLPLLAVFVIGTGKYGRQWLNLGLFYLQPAELLKISMPMMAAWYLHQRPLPPRLFTVLVTAVIIGVPTGLIMLQPDFGTAVLIAASGVFVLYLAGLSVVVRHRRGVRRGDRRAGDVCADRLVLHAASVPEGPHPDLPRPGKRPAQRRLEHHPVQDRDRLRRLERQGLGPGQPVAPELHPRADHRLRLLGAERGIRLDRRGHRAGAVSVRGGALPVDRGQRARYLFAADRRRHRPVVLRLRAGQRRHDFRPAAGGRRADAADELWRHLGGVVAGRAGRGDGGEGLSPGERGLLIRRMLIRINRPVIKQGHTP
jgi:hypothetical protein